MSLLEALINVSEKAASIARLCRQEQHLFELLVEEKSSNESNPRFVQDFKTLADVLIQETVKYDIGLKFPELKDSIKGEEDNLFCNTIGEKIIVQVQSDVALTANLLQTVLNDDNVAAKLLAEEVHKSISLEDVDVSLNNIKDVELDYRQLGIWIDPIDSTAEYINAKEVIGDYGIFASGLQCVTVLIGVFDKSTGVPIMGIVNQPFFKQVQNRWGGRCYWGLSTPTETLSSLTEEHIAHQSNVICISSSEDESIKRKLQDAGFKLIEAAGAGYKILTVITRQAAAYVLSKNTTFKWDTCGPQAILKSMGGNIVQYNTASKSYYKPIEYTLPYDNGNKIKNCCNDGGIIAFYNQEVFTLIMEGLCK
ncbi:hypothetical protein RI129_001065 [Pyrocoelia pectoralis]|uniref:inositol-1,4-bisphosphate 1-phosphatase n=1 Tax=Pyrocoelia pectoralis TaxID=417401 RepID=A0AAN7VST2_9COLE